MSINVSPIIYHIAICTFLFDDLQPAGGAHLYLTFTNDHFVSSYHFLQAFMDATFKGRGRMTIEEVCAYQVQDGKIILEQFFF